MNALIAEDCPKITRIPRTRSMATSGVIHHSLRRQKKVRSPPAIPTRAVVLRAKRRTMFTGGSPERRGVDCVSDSNSSVSKRCRSTPEDLGPGGAGPRAMLGSDDEPPGGQPVRARLGAPREPLPPRDRAAD